VQIFTARTREAVAATPRTRIIVVDVDPESFVFHAGQAVFAGLADGSVKRPYSIACSPGQARRDRAIELLVQIDDHNQPDPHLERATAGTWLRVEGPFGSFGLPSPLPERHLLLMAGGTGIAPLRSIMWDTLDREPGVDITLLYSVRGSEEFAYLEELASLQAEGRVDLFLTVTRERRDTWTGGRGRIDRQLIASALKSIETRCVVCGPAGFVADLTALLLAAGVAPQRVLTETYTS
jgi:ferredoxin-NADP reductase